MVSLTAVFFYSIDLRCIFSSFFPHFSAEVFFLLFFVFALASQIFFFFFSDFKPAQFFPIPVYCFLRASLTLNSNKFYLPSQTINLPHLSSFLSYYTLIFYSYIFLLLFGSIGSSYK